MGVRSFLPLVVAGGMITFALAPGRLVTAASSPSAGTPAAFIAGQPVTLPGHVPDVVAKGLATPVGYPASDQTISFAVGLAIRNPGALNQFLQSVNNPASSGYHQYL